MRISSHRLERPTFATLSGVARRTLGVRSDPVLQSALQTLGLGQDPSVTELLRLGEHLAAQDGLVGLVGTSMVIRCQTYLSLERDR